MQLATASSSAPTTDAAIKNALEQLNRRIASPDLLIVVGTVGYDMERVHQSVRLAYPNTPIQGGTSCAGVMTDEGFVGEDGRALALFGIEDERGAFGVGAAEMGDDPAGATRKAIEQAMRCADRPGELPTAVWLMSAPGLEEEVVATITETLGPKVPLIGGSSADNTIEGHWRQFDTHGVYQGAVTVALLYMPCYVTTAFHMGYDATEHAGVVTKVDDRLVHEIDGRPAAEVYDEWTGGRIRDIIDAGGGNLLERSNLAPIGRSAGRFSGIDCYQLSHPESCDENGSIMLFTDVDEGERLVCMTGSVDNLVARASDAARTAQMVDDVSRDRIRGGLVIFCAGCFLTVQERIDDVHQSFKEAVGDIPFLTAFTFGEQGRMLDGNNKHGNLMISTLLFTDWDDATAEVPS